MLSCNKEHLKEDEPKAYSEWESYFIENDYNTHMAILKGQKENNMDYRIA